MAKTSDLDMLIKLLGMTSVDNDNQSLLATRKANQLVREAFGDWESLLRGKITIIADPFTVPPPAKTPDRPKPPPPMAPRPAAAPIYKSPPPPPPPPPPRNRFAGMTPIAGNTYPIKDALKAMGALYDGTSKQWFVPDNRLQDALDLLSKAPPLKAMRGRSRRTVSLEELDDAF